jgi:hypothetical protein
MFKDTVLSNFLFALLLTNTLAVVPAQAQEPAKPELKVGFVPGPYNDPVNLQRALWVLPPFREISRSTVA